MRSVKCPVCRNKVSIYDGLLANHRLVPPALELCPTSMKPVEEVIKTIKKEDEGDKVDE